MDGSRTNRKPPRGRTVTACVECQRRKKKCDRQWPCNHCQSRNISHLCHFGHVKANRQIRPLGDSTGSLPFAGGAVSADTHKKDSSTLISSASSYHSGTSLVECVSAVKGLAYVDSGMFRALHQTVDASPEPSGCLQLPEHVAQAIRTIPPRPYTDALMRNFFDCVNYHYCILHQPHFMASYVEWWASRRSVSSSSSSSSGGDSASFAAFACLVLRMCANSAQFLTPAAAADMEADLGESISNLGSGFNTAAQVISDFLPPGAGGLVHAQQLFFAATWHKGEADFLKSWHDLAASVRQAQEIGVHHDATSDSMPDIERELRRRLWSGLNTWDRFMVATFNRAPIIQTGTSVPFPSPSLDQIPGRPEVPSMVVATVLENRLARQFSEADPTNAGSLADKLAYVEGWMASLPAAFRAEGTDTRWDVEYPRLVFQRLQLQLMGYMTQLLLLRPLLTSSSSSFSSPPPRFEGGIESAATPELLAHAVDVSLKCMARCRDMFDVCFPQQTKYFMVAFCPFDNGALLCSLLIHHDKRRAQVPRRTEVLVAIGQALQLTRRMSEYTKLASAAWTILSTLSSRIDLDATERKLLKDTEMATGWETNVLETCSSAPTGPDTNNSNARLGGGPSLGVDDPWGLSLPMEEGLFGVDLGILDGVWDWDSLQLGPLDGNAQPQ